TEVKQKEDAHTNVTNESWNIGMRRVNKILDEEEKLGHKAWATGLHSNMPDVIVINPDANLGLNQSLDSIIRVYEATNYSTPQMYISLDRAERYRDTLLQFNAEKILVCSYEENLRYIGGAWYFEKCGIKVRIIGYQD
ncbi:MAG: hypothetical protein ACXAAH_15115, partial [Promethearchaeota archaeon]